MWRTLPAVVVLGCAGRVTAAAEGDAGTDAVWSLDGHPVPDVEDDGVEYAPACELASGPPCAHAAPDVIFTPGPGETVVDATAEAVLLDPLRVVVLERAVPKGSASPATADARLRPVALATGTSLTASKGLRVLACDETRCRSFRVAASLIFEADLPSTVRALTAGGFAAGGEGIYRLDGLRWTKVLDGDFVAITEFDDGAGFRRVTAVGAGGRVVALRDGGFVEVPNAIKERLVHVSSFYERIAAVGESGLVYFGTWSGLSPCSGTPLRARRVHLDPFSRAMQGVTREGATFTVAADGTTCVGAPGGLIDAFVVRCGVGTHDWTVSPRSVSGGFVCAYD